MEITKLEKIAKILPGKNKPLYIKQIQYAIYKLGIVDFMAITTIPLDIRQKLKEELGSALSLKSIYEQEGGQAHKVLLETKTGERIETVRMLFKPNNDDSYESLCISSQSGCAMDCQFCSTGAIGFKKNLTTEEITDQVLYFMDSRLRGNDKEENISFMGMGEPLANPEIFEALKILTDKEYFGISQRKINVSTIGIVPQIKRLTKEFPQVNLAFSLHSPYPAQRLELMPITKAYPIEAVMKVLDERIRATNRRIFLAYLLLKGVNDSQKHAQAVVDLIKKRGRHWYLYHVNLIRYNPGPSMVEFKAPTEKTVKNFIEVLDKNNISWSLRQSFGQKIFAACGQLYGGYNKIKVKAKGFLEF